ncbi:hypothetical protein C1646_765253 [Rhizophagus diaphanus]|nr:hypothetical protein C1646_765253 [Rhizophagus diaphanus] [Rhizophagus sp. MUCL 43196]
MALQPNYSITTFAFLIVYQYILDRSKIIAKLYESGLGGIKEFSDTPIKDTSQPDISHNETGNIPIFNIPETISQKITPFQPEENLPSRGKKANKQDDSTQDLFNYVTGKAPVALTSGTSEIFKTPEPVIDGSETSKHPESNEPICEVVNTSPKKTTSKLPDSSKPINEVSSTILLSRAQREERLRKKAVKLGENPDAFTEEDLKEYMDMKVQKRLIGEEIIRHSLEDEGITSSWLDTDKEWQKNISILQKNDKEKRRQARDHLQKGYKFSKEQAYALIPHERIKWYISQVPVLEELELEAEVNISIVYENVSEGETIREMAQRIVRDNLSERDVKAISRTLVKTAFDPVVASSRLSRLRRELRILNAPEKIISATKIPEITRASNKIQQKRTEQCKNEGLHYSDHFLLESVKEWLDLYVVSNTPDKQALADITGKNEKRVRQLLTWIQEAIISGVLKDPEKPGSTYLSSFLKKDEYIPKPYELLLPSSLRKLGAMFASVVHKPKNLSKANTYASEALRHSPNNHTSPSDRYTIVNFRRKGQPYDQAKPFWISDEN